MTSVSEAVAALANGDPVGMPTDTVYGLAANPWSQDGCRALIELKLRPPDRAIPLLAASIEAAGDLVQLSTAAEELAARHWPGALTLILPRLPGAPAWLGDERGTLGVRVPAHSLALELLKAAGPLAVTSANLSGGDPARDDAGARAIFGDRVACYLGGAAGGGEASTVLDLTVDPPRVLRVGPVVVE